MQILQPISNKSWQTIIAHAMKCKLDDKRFLFRTVQGMGLLFNSIYKVVGVTFDGEIFQSVNSLNAFHKVASFTLTLYLSPASMRCFILFAENGYFGISLT